MQKVGEAKTQERRARLDGPCSGEEINIGDRQNKADIKAPDPSQRPVCYARVDKDAPSVTPNLIKLRVGRYLNVPLHRRLKQLDFLQLFLFINTIYNI